MAFIKSVGRKINAFILVFSEPQELPFGFLVSMLSCESLEVLEAAKCLQWQRSGILPQTLKILPHPIAEGQPRLLWEDYLFLELRSMWFLNWWWIFLANGAEFQLLINITCCCLRSCLETLFWGPDPSSMWNSQCWWELTYPFSLLLCLRRLWSEQLPLQM